MKCLILSITLIMCHLFTNAKNITVVDSYDNSTLAGATIISHNGIILGITNNNGQININENQHLPISIRCIGYTPLTIAHTNDTIRMEATSYPLSEVVVSTHERQIRRVLCYIREYCTSTTSQDTLQLYSEHMAAAYGAPNRVKGLKGTDSTPRSINARHYTRYANSEGKDSIASSDREEDIQALSFWNIISSIPFDLIEETDKMKNGATSDTIAGKYCNKRILKKLPNCFIDLLDPLADKKDHTWSPWILKLLGLTTDFTELYTSNVYSLNSSRKYGIDDFIYGSFSMKIYGKGKIFKKIFKIDEPVAIYSLVEVYPIEITRLTVEEYKEDKENLKEIDFIIPRNITPLTPEIKSLVDRIELEKPSKKN